MGIKTYQFTICMVGEGEDEHRAWEDAVEYAMENLKDFLRTPSDYEEITED